MNGGLSTVRAVARDNTDATFIRRKLSRWNSYPARYYGLQRLAYLVGQTRVGDFPAMISRAWFSPRANPVTLAFDRLLIAFFRGGRPLTGILGVRLRHLFRKEEGQLSFGTFVRRGRPFVFVEASIPLESPSRAIYELFTERPNYSRRRRLHEPCATLNCRQPESGANP